MFILPLGNDTLNNDTTTYDIENSNKKIYLCRTIDESDYDIIESFINATSNSELDCEDNLDNLSNVNIIQPRHSSKINTQKLIIDDADYYHKNNKQLYTNIDKNLNGNRTNASIRKSKVGPVKQCGHTSRNKGRHDKISYRYHKNKIKGFNK